MPDTINLQMPESSKASTINTVRSAAKGPGQVDRADPAGDQGSFQESMSKVQKENGSDPSIQQMEKDGNALPVNDETTMETAETDRQMMTGVDGQSADMQEADIALPGLSLSGRQGGNALSEINDKVAADDVAGLMTEDILLAVPLPVKETATSVAEDSSKNDGLTSLLSTPVRQLMQSESQLQSTKLKGVANAGSSADADNNLLLRQPELTLQKLESFDFFNPKNIMSGIQAGLTAGDASQLTASTDLQSALLSRTSAGTADVSINISSTALTSTSSTTSPLNMTALPQAEISQQFGRSGWSEGMGKQILWLANQNIKSAEIRLNPAHLGPIEVKLDISDDQVNVALTSRHAAVREAMDMALPKLREMFDGNGLSLSDADISQHSFAEQREQNMSGSSGGGNNMVMMQGDMPQADPELVSRLQLSTSMVDYYI